MRAAQPGNTTMHPSSPPAACITTTVESAEPEGGGPFAAQWTAAIKFSAPSVEPRSEERCDPVKAILPGGTPPSPEKAKAIAAEEMCIVSVP